MDNEINLIGQEHAYYPYCPCPRCELISRGCPVPDVDAALSGKKLLLVPSNVVHVDFKTRIRK